MALGIIEPMMTLLPRETGSFVLAPLPQDERGLIHTYGNEDGNVLQFRAQPISQSYTGDRAWSFVDDFYFRIYVLPNQIDFGAVVTTISRPVTIWNAYFTDVSFLSAVSSGSDVSFTGEALPAPVPALNIKEWEFTVGPDGPPSIDETYTLTFDTGDVVDVQITGTRSLLWPFLPNWRSPVTISRTHKTDIITSRGGQEQRIAERATSRRQIEFLISKLDADKLRHFRRLMAYWQDRPFLVADPSRTTKTADAMNSGTDTVEITADKSWLVEDAAVVLHNKSINQIGLRIVDSVDSANIVTFKDTDTYDWPAGTTIACGIVGQLVGDRTGTRVLNTAQEMSVRFMQLPGSEIEVIRDPENIWNGRELFTRRPNWASTINAQDLHPVDVIDYGSGRVEFNSPVEFSSAIWSGQYLGRDADMIEEFLHFFERMKGKQGEFYMPTWEYDIVVKLPLQSGTQGLRVEGLDYLTAYENDTTSRAVVVMLKDGTHIYRAIEEMLEITDGDGTDTLINMTELWADTIQLDEIDRVSWVRVWRFASDEVQAEFVTNTVANMQLSMQSLEDLAAELDESVSP